MSDEHRDPRIEALDYIAGVKVVDIGDVRVARGMTRRPFNGCSHVKLIYDTRERRIWCEDCENNVEAFDAFTMLVERFHDAEQKIRRRQAALDEAEAAKLVSVAARQIDKAWRHRGAVPACPSCGLGLFPEDFKRGVTGMLSREYATALRKRALEKKRT